MATIRVRDWTKKQIDRILEEESHSSHDSVIKSLLKDRELAKFAGHGADIDDEPTEEEPRPPEDKAFDDLTVLDEMHSADNGVLFLWCPNCGNELAHLTLENPVDISIFEMECQRCLTHLDQHAIIAIEIGYPIEERLVDDDLQGDLKECVIDYWNRNLEQFTEGADEELDVEQRVWQFDQYVRNFQWDWPADVPAVGFEAGSTYRNEVTGERIEVVEPVTENRNALDSFEVRRYPEGADPSDAETEIMDSNAIADLIINRSLYVVESGPSSESPADRV
ncbi:hypothetical protein G9464_18170 [Halostella sp. JP-L12]|uniref:hypothetical protein n=1 Tax=Halostella TaxID=1843185 RepID=UPI000EF76139|nr:MULTISPECIES: hypothetical protein [Halostella]NHN49499.1 hypothetical protein [Halostella sp. JP-L12]